MLEIFQGFISGNAEAHFLKLNYFGRDFLQISGWLKKTSS